MVIEVEKLRELELKKISELRKIQNKLRDAEERIELPELKKKFEGKYFKYRNSYGGDSSWWLFAYCKEVKGVYHYVCDTFESFDDKNEFKLNDVSSGQHLFQQQIPKSAYNHALKMFLKKASQLNKQSK